MCFIGVFCFCFIKKVKKSAKLVSDPARILPCTQAGSALQMC